MFHSYAGRTCDSFPRNVLRGEVGTLTAEIKLENEVHALRYVAANDAARGKK